MLIRALAGVLLALTVAAGSAAAEEVKATTPVVQDAKWAVKWWMPRHKQKIADAKKQAKIDLLMIGDSITHGWENKAGKATWDKYYAKRNAFNIGFSGDRTEHVVWRLQNGAVEGMSPKLIVIMIGTNNTGHRQDKPEHTTAGVRMILDECKKRMPKSKILLLAIFPRDAKPDGKLRKINDAINPMIAKLADDKTVYFLDINKKFLTADGELTKEIMPDRLHPKAKGYGIWAEAMEPSIKKLMGEE